MTSYNKINSRSRYTIENYKAALDTCGEWYLDRAGYLFYIPNADETIDKLNVMAPVTEQFVIIKGNENVYLNEEPLLDVDHPVGGVELYKQLQK